MLTQPGRLAGPPTTPPIIEDWDIRLGVIKLLTKKEITKPTTTLFTRKKTSEAKMKPASRDHSFSNRVIVPF